jgi:hypothetical protein
MDPLNNPFSPGAGAPPPELAGRDVILEDARIALGRIRRGLPAKSLILVGLRGVGKTVLLVRIREMAEAAGYRAVPVEATETKELPALLVPSLRQTLLSLDSMESISAKVKRGLRVLAGFVGRFKATIGDLEIGIEPERGAADSGDLETDLGALLVAVAEAAADRRTAVAILVDELQYLTEKELSALIMAVHLVSQRSLPLVLVGAGLPQVVGLAGRSKSYSERLFDFPQIGPLESKDARVALQGPAESQGMRFTEGAIGEVIRVTQGYPFFLQQWGFEAWNLAEGPPIELATIRAATAAATIKLDQSFFRVRFDRLTPREKDYLRAMAELGATAQRSGDIADALGVKVQSVAPLRSALIKKGMIYSPAHGDTAFTVPLFDEFLKRVMPKSPRSR